MGDVREGNDVWVFLTLIVGFALSFLISVVPHFSGAFRLEPMVLAAWMLPYLILSVIVYFLTGPMRWRAVLAVAGAQLITAWIQRGLLGSDADTLLYVVALLTAAALVLLAPQLRGQLDGGLLGPLVMRFVKKSSSSGAG